MGAGAVGGYFGARLAAAGEDVTFIARGRHLEAIRAAGLRVLSSKGDLAVRPARATDDPGETGPVDIVLFCVKLWDTDSAGREVRPLVGQDTGVISLQNGVEPEERLAAILGARHVMGGTAAIAAVIAEPGVIRHTGSFARLEFGELDDRRSGRAEAFLAACVKAGIDAAIAEHVGEAIWRKFVVLTAVSAATCLVRSPIGPIREDPAGRVLVQRLIEESAAVARAKGIAVADDLEARSMEVVEGLPAEMKSSMLQDLERGNRLEVAWLSGAVARLGGELGIVTPCHDVAVAALNPHAAGAP